MKKNSLLFLLLVSLWICSGFQAEAQTSNPGESFSEFRNKILGNYNEFRNTILEHYADFLNGEWHEYESLKGLERDSNPKPIVPPSVDNSLFKPTEKPTEEPREEKPVISSLPDNDKDNDSEGKTSPSESLTPRRDEVLFSFYGIPMTLPDLDVRIAEDLFSPSDFADQWKNLDKRNVAAKFIPNLKNAISQIGLNDFLTYKYLESFANAKFPYAGESSRVSFIHYILVNLGLDVRIAASSKGVPMLLLPFNQTVYGKSYLILNNKKYYIFLPDDQEVGSILNDRVMTCQLPTDVNIGKNMDLLLGELNIPDKPKEFSLEYGPLHIEGELNENLIPILYRYPQMPIGAYMKSNLQPLLRQRLCNQIKSQLGSMDTNEAVETLLHFTQNAFQYATDDSYHGFEKPYFLEETLFYPKNDCEDRAIFYSYFLYNALNRDARLLAFPGHEAVGVHLDSPVHGTSYRFDDKTFYISDPTYIGASTGMVMPSFLNVSPVVDFSFE